MTKEKIISDVTTSTSIVGNLDKTVPISVSKKWSQILPKTSYHEISGAGHLVHEEKPYEVSQIILNHLQAIKK